MTADLDGLIEQFPEIHPGNYSEDDAIALNNWGIDAVAALIQLREENARLNDECERERMRLTACGVAALGYHKDGDSIHPDYESASLSDVHQLTAKLERAEAEVARLKERLEAQFKRLTSMDGLLANAESRIAALEAERDCANDRADTHLADAYSMRNQRDALDKEQK